METVVSGIRPTGNLHLGNYFGAVKSFLRMQDEYNCFFFIADWHSLTTHPHPDNIRNSVKTILSEYLACGIDPEKATIYIQSDVPEVVELYLYLNMNAGIGELMRTASFKDKARQQLHISREGCEGDVEKEIFNEGNKHSVSAGLLTYPTLMAADIIIHKALKVPVGKDQEQNMEMARRFARRFNSTYGVDFFPEPASFHLGDKSVKVPGLDGSGKMGKSEGNAIYLIDDEKTIKKKVMKAVSDAGPTEPNSVKPEPIANLFTMMEIVSEKETYDFFNEKYNNCEIRYGDMKKQLAEDINKFCAPIRERILDMAANTEYLDKVARMGAEKARESASKTLNEVRQIIERNCLYQYFPHSEHLLSIHYFDGLNDLNCRSVPLVHRVKSTTECSMQNFSFFCCQQIHNRINLVINRIAFIVKPAQSTVFCNFRLEIIENIGWINFFEHGFHLLRDTLHLIQRNILWIHAEGKIHSRVQTCEYHLRTCFGGIFYFSNGKRHPHKCFRQGGVDIQLWNIPRLKFDQFILDINTSFQCAVFSVFFPPF